MDGWTDVDRYGWIPHRRILTIRHTSYVDYPNHWPLLRTLKNRVYGVIRHVRHVRHTLPTGKSSLKE